VLSIIALFVSFFAICHLVRTASVKEFLVEVMLFAVALLGVWVGR